MLLAFNLRVDMAALSLTIQQLQGTDNKGVSWCRVNANIANVAVVDKLAETTESCIAGDKLADSATLDLPVIAGTVKGECQALGYDVADAAPAGVIDAEETVLTGAADTRFSFSCLPFALLVILAIVFNWN
jgi:hypothetical protein